MVEKPNGSFRGSLDMREEKRSHYKGASTNRHSRRDSTGDGGNKGGHKETVQEMEEIKVVTKRQYRRWRK